MYLRGAFILAISACSPFISTGQVWQVFDMTTAGLPSNTARAIAHDGQGGTWVGTDWGLCHFDGSVWEVFQVQDGLAENDVRALAFDGQGRLWIGFFSQGLMVKDGDTWTQYVPGTSPMPSDQVRNITIDGQDNAWIATTNGLVRTDLVEWRIYNDTDTSYNNQMLPGVNISDVAVRGDGLVCVGTLNAGFVYLSSTSVLFYNSVNDALPDNTALGVAIDSEGDRLAACPSGGLLRLSGPYDNGLFFQFTSDVTGIPSNALNDIVIDPFDRKIIATQSAGFTILSANNVTWTTFNTGNSGLPDNEVTTVSLAPDGAIWAATGMGGVARFDPTAAVPGGLGTLPMLNVYPNPFQEQVNLEVIGSSGRVDWTVSDPLGRIVRTGHGFAPGILRIEILGLPYGIFSLHVRCSDGMRSLPILRE